MGPRFGWRRRGHGWLAVWIIAGVLAIAPPAASQDATPVVDGVTSEAPLPAPTAILPPPAPTALPSDSVAPDPEPSLAGPEPTAEPGLPAHADTATLAATPAVPRDGLDTSADGMDVQAVLSVLSVADAGEVSCAQIPAGDAVVSAGGYIVFQCENPPPPPDLLLDGFPNYYLRVLDITPGWRWSYRLSALPPAGDPNTDPESWSGPLSAPIPPQSGGQNNATAFIALGPDPAGAEPGEGTVTIEFLQGLNYQQRGAPYPTPRTATLGATYTAPATDPCTPVASAEALAFGTSARTEAGYAPAARDLVLAIAVPGAESCPELRDGWVIQVSADPLDGPDGATIPPGAIAYAGAAASGSAPAGLTATDVGFPLSTTAQTIASGSGPIPSATWRAAFVLTPPADAPPGTYAGTLTIDIGAAGP